MPRAFPFIAAIGVIGLATLMPMRADRLPSGVRPDHYDLAFDVDLTNARFGGRETIRVQLAEPTTSIVLNAAEIEFHAATIRTGTNTERADVTLDSAAQTATLTVDRRLPAGSAEIHLEYTGILNDRLRGFYLSRANGRRYGITQFESSDARRAFPCFDDPALKATFSLTVTVDRDDTVISNGRLLTDTPGPGAGRHTVTFSPTPKMSSYLVAMAVGDFECLEDRAENIPIRVCATGAKKELGHIALEWGKQILTFYNGYYAMKYPFGKLDMVAVPDFAAGAMENTAAIFYRETDLLASSDTASVSARKNIASVVAHEMAHQWFGDIVTMRWWDDLWLNEGFATWMANRPLAAFKPEWNIGVDEIDETRRALNLDALTTTRPIHSNVETPDQIEESFDAIAYEKGAAVMRMIEHYVGGDALRKGINAYLERHAYANATSEDFWTAITSASGKPVDRILSTFVNQPGAPVLEVTVECRDRQTEITLQQGRFFYDAAATRGAAAAVRWQIPICVKTPSQQTGTSCQVVTNTTETFTVGPGCQPWAYVNAGAQGYFRTAYSPSVLRALAPDVETRLSAPERSSLADDEWALLRAGRHSVADFLTLAGGFGQEHTAGVLSQITDRLSFIDNYLTTDQTRLPFKSWVRNLLKPLYTELGVGTPSDDPDGRRELRAVVINALGGIADDPEVIASARDMLDQALKDPQPSARASLDATSADALVYVAAQHGDGALYDALLAATARATLPEERNRYLHSLTQFEDPALTDRALEYALSPDLGRQDAALYVSRLLNNPVVHARAWEFVKAHWTELLPKLTVAFGDARIVEALGSFCSVESRDDIKTFFETHRLGTASRTITLAIERINNCIAIKDRETQILTSWIR